MTKLPASDKTSNYVKPLIKKGYYPAQLLKVEPFADKDGNLIEGNYGHQLIFEFAIYSKIEETGEPVEPITFKKDKEDNTSETVIIPKFVYHQYKDKQNPGEFQTAITPKSAITRLLVALGWTFNADGVDPDDFIGKWVEVNVNDYEKGEGENKEKFSTIESVQKYEGPEPSKDLISVKPKEKKEVKKQIKHKAVEEDIDESKGAQVPPKGTIEELEAKKISLQKMCDEGFLTKQGLDDSLEQIESQIEELKK